MRFVACLACALLLPALGACSDGSSVAPRSIFTEQNYERARSTAEVAGKLFLIDGTAEWCGPCKRMDRNTWADARVAAALRDDVIAYQLDVDREPRIASKLGILRLPTLMLMRGRKTISTRIGYLSPTDFLAWLESVKKTES